MRFTLYTLLLLLALAEGAARLAEWVHPGRDQVSFEYAPYRMLKMARAPWPLDRDGFRARELASYRGSFLVEFLGGSVCLGVGTDTGPTVPERLEQALRREGLEHAQVLNLCQGGVSSAQELAIFLQYGLPLEPQVVLSFDGANDVMHPAPIGEDPAANLPYFDAGMRARIDGQDGWSHLAAVRVLARLAARWRTPGPGSIAAVPEREILDSYFYTLSIDRTLAEARGAWYAVLLQPTLHYRKPWSAEEAAMWRSRRPRDAAALSRTAGERYGEARDALAQWTAATGTAWYDLTGAFANCTSAVYSDSVHFRGPAGYALLFEELKRQGLVTQIAARYRAWEKQPWPQ